VEEGAKGALGDRSAASRPDVEQQKRIKQLERALCRSHLQTEILRNVLGESAAGKPIRRHGSWQPIRFLPLAIISPSLIPLPIPPGNEANDDNRWFQPFGFWEGVSLGSYTVTSRLGYFWVSTVR
jgi:hypothetical protein